MKFLSTLFLALTFPLLVFGQANPSYNSFVGSNGVLISVSGIGQSKKLTFGFKDGTSNFLANAAGVLVNNGSGLLSWAAVSQTNLFDSDNFYVDGSSVVHLTNVFNTAGFIPVSGGTKFTNSAFKMIGGIPFITNQFGQDDLLKWQTTNGDLTIGLNTLGGSSASSTKSMVLNSSLGSVTLQSIGKLMSLTGNTFSPGESNALHFGTSGTPIADIWMTDSRITATNGVLYINGIPIVSSPWTDDGTFTMYGADTNAFRFIDTNGGLTIGQSTHSIIGAWAGEDGSTLYSYRDVNTEMPYNEIVIGLWLNPTNRSIVDLFNNSLNEAEFFVSASTNASDSSVQGEASFKARVNSLDPSQSFLDFRIISNSVWHVDYLGNQSLSGTTNLIGDNGSGITWNGLPVSPWKDDGTNTFLIDNPTVFQFVNAAGALGIHGPSFSTITLYGVNPDVYTDIGGYDNGSYFTIHGTNTDNPNLVSFEPYDAGSPTATFRFSSERDLYADDPTALIASFANKGTNALTVNADGTISLGNKTNLIGMSAGGQLTVDGVPIGGGGTGLTNWAHTLFVTTDGDDSTALPYEPQLPFLTIQSAMSNAVFGDVIFIGPGTFGINTRIDCADGVSVIGSGETETHLINHITDEMVFYVTISNTIANLHILNVRPDTDQSWIGNHDFGITNLVMRNLWLEGDADGFWFDGANGSFATGYNLDCNAKADVIVVNSGDTSVINFYNSSFRSIGPSEDDPAFLSRGIDVSGLYTNVVNFYNCYVYGSTNSIYIEAASYGTVNLYNTVTDGGPPDVKTTGTLNFINANAQGTITLGGETNRVGMNGSGQLTVDARSIYLPSGSNTVDFGSSALPWRTNYASAFTVVGSQRTFAYDEGGTNVVVEADTIRTADPGSGIGSWKFGKKLTGLVLTLVSTNAIEVQIDGQTYKLALVQ